MTDQTKPRPRVILEQQDDGSLVLEYYINGNRTRETLSRGFEMIAVRDALAFQARDIVAAAERKQIMHDIEAAARHRRVWQIAASRTNQGVEFANRVIGPINGHTHAAKSPKPDAIQSSEALL
jgi:hypothetical protein